MRLIHYSKKPLIAVRSKPHSENGCGCYKTPGLWVSVEGEYDWPWWCQGENWRIEDFVHATEIILKPEARICHLSTSKQLDAFTREFVPADRLGEWDCRIDWPRIRKEWQALIIAPYQWDRRLELHTSWYYGWDCASGVIWNADAVAELRPAELPDFSKIEAA